MNKNEPLAVNRRIPVYLVDTSGAGVAGITWTSPPAAGEVRISQAGAASVNASGTMGVDETGKYYYEATQAETNFDGLYFILDVAAKGSARRFVYSEPMSSPIVGAVWDVARSSHTTSGSFGEGVPVAPSGISSTAFSTDAISSAAVSAAAVTKIQSGLATSSALTSAQASLDIISGLLKENSIIDNTTFSGVNMTAARIRVFSNKAAAQAATVGSSNGADGETQRYLITATYSGSNMTSYTLVKDL